MFDFAYKFLYDADTFVNTFMFLIFVSPFVGIAILVAMSSGPHGS